MDEVIKEMMEKELWELDRKGIKKVKGKRVDEFGRRMFDATGSYIPPYNRPSVGLVKETKKLDHSRYRNKMRRINQWKIEEIKFGKE